MNKNGNFKSESVVNFTRIYIYSVNQTSEYEWHEFPWHNSIKLPPGPHKKLKIYADANITSGIIKELRAANTPIVSVTEEGYSSHPDKDIYQQTMKKKKILLTMDKDFWDDKKYPLQKGPGIIFLDIPPDQTSKAIAGLAKYYPADHWKGMKARITENRFVIKYHTWEGRVSEDEFLFSNDGKLFTKKVR